MQGRLVHVVGGANSAGQAALHLAGHAAHVTLVVRRSNLAETMSDYIVRAIQAAPKVTVRYRTEVIDGSGDGQLTTLTLRDRSTGALETVATGGLFLLIGGEPHTSWLPASILRDDGAIWSLARTFSPHRSSVFPGTCRNPHCTSRPACPACSPSATSDMEE
jgi:thioredoxin reductase (NADPH)